MLPLDDLGVSENCVPLNPMVNDHYPIVKWLFPLEYTLFSDKPIYVAHILPQSTYVLPIDIYTCDMYLLPIYYLCTLTTLHVFNIYRTYYLPYIPMMPYIPYLSYLSYIPHIPYV